MDVGDLIETMLPVVTAVGGGLWAFYVYLDHKKESDRAHQLQAKKDATTREIESRKPFLELQLRLYLDAVKVAGLLVSEDVSSDSWRNMVKRFWALYWSELSMVESEAVERAMVEIGKVLKNIEMTGSQTQADLQPLVYNLSHIVRREIETAWRGTTTPQT
jgi:hypothetical protein